MAIRPLCFCHGVLSSCAVGAILISLSSTTSAFAPITAPQTTTRQLRTLPQASPLWLASANGDCGKTKAGDLGSSAAPAVTDRRTVVRDWFAAAGLTATAIALVSSPTPALAAGDEVNLQQYEDFVKSPEGWSYRDVTAGSGASPDEGDRVVYEWSGYTIGYFGRPFEAKGGPRGGAFDKEQDYSRTVLGKGDVVLGMDRGMRSMKVGGVRQIIVPYGELSYPPTKDGDAAHDKVGPKPATFSGQRALNFVLDNPRVDRTLLFNVKLVRVDKPDGSGGFKRGDRA